MTYALPQGSLYYVVIARSLTFVFRRYVGITRDFYPDYIPQ